MVHTKIQFCDMHGNLLQEIPFDAAVPIPRVDENVEIDWMRHRVNTVHYRYLPMDKQMTLTVTIGVS